MNELILILGAGIFQKSFILTAVNNNYNIILFDKYEPTWIKDFASISFFNIDISNTKECLKKAREYSLNAVVSPYNDAGILSCSLIANEQKLPGPGLFASELSRNKSKFRGFLKTNKFRTPLCYEVSSTENLKEVSKILVVPAVIKPNDGSGSRGVFYIGSIDELDFRYEQSKEYSSTGTVLLEEFISGTEYSAECVIQNGKFFLLGFCKKTRSPLPRLLDVSLIFPHNFSIEIQNMIVTELIRLTKALMIKSTFLHVEFIINNNELYIIEYGVRGASFDVYTKLISWSYDLDLNKLLLDLITNKSLEVPKINESKVSTLIFPEPLKKGKLIKISHDSGKYYQGDTEIEVKNLFSVGEVVSEIENGSMRIAAIYYFAYSLEKLNSDVINFKFCIEVE